MKYYILLIVVVLGIIVAGCTTPTGIEKDPAMMEKKDVMVKDNPGDVMIKDDAVAEDTSDSMMEKSGYTGKILAGTEQTPYREFNQADYELALKENKDIYLIGAKGIIFDELPYFMPGFEKERIKKKLKFICLCDRKEVQNKLVKKPFFKCRAFPNGFESNVVVNIFGNKTTIVLWKEKYPTGFLIENKDVAEAFRKWFKFMYAV